jgi:hypothetical protein
MNLFQRLTGRLTGMRNRYGDDDWPSVVLLLREPDFPAPRALLELAQKAWGAGGPIKVVGTLNEKRSHVFSCTTAHGPLWFSIHRVPERYGGEGREPLELIQKPWDEHRGWMAIDSPHQRNNKLAREKALGEIYKVLLIYSFLIWSPNVLAIFFPAERTTIPNFGELAASIQWGRRTGLDLSFLD